MPTIQEVKDTYKQLHDELSTDYYGGTSGLTKEEFDQQHSENWDNMAIAIKQASDYVEPPAPPLDYSTHFGQVLAIDMVADRPLRVNTDIHGVWYEHDCFITEWVNEYYLQGHKLEVDDWVLVNFIENSSVMPIVTEKLHVTWEGQEYRS